MLPHRSMLDAKDKNVYLFESFIERVEWIRRYKTGPLLAQLIVVSAVSCRAVCSCRLQECQPTLITTKAFSRSHGRVSREWSQ
jgi:hypothetical protein